MSRIYTQVIGYACSRPIYSGPPRESLRGLAIRCCKEKVLRCDYCLKIQMFKSLTIFIQVMPTLPTIYATALYALDDRAHLRAGEVGQDLRV